MYPDETKQLILSPREKGALKITTTGNPTVTVTPAGLTMTQVAGNPFMLQFTFDADPTTLTETKAFLIEGTVQGHSDVAEQAVADTVDVPFSGATVVMVVPRNDPRGIDFGDAGNFIPEPAGGDQPVPDQVPTLTSLSPNTGVAAGSAVTVTCTGTNFVPASKVQSNAGGNFADLTTTYVSATSVTASVPAAPSPGNHMLRVANVAGPSTALNFTWTATVTRTKEK